MDETTAGQTEQNFPRGDVEAALDRIVRSREFLKNRNSAQFLKFVVAETLEGRGHRLKAYSIATMALDRDVDFDPQSNSIVRVQAARVRQLLQNYYSGPGAGDPLRILMPAGSYHPVFEPARKEAQSPASREFVRTTDDAPAQPEGEAAEPRRVFGAWAAATAVLVAITAALALTVGLVVRNSGPAVDPRLRPTVRINVIGPTPQEFASITPFLERALTQRLLAYMIGDVRTSEGANGRAIAYELTVLSRAAGPGRADFSFQLLHSDSQDVLYTRTFTGIDISNAESLQPIAARVAAHVADDYGALLGDFRKRAAGYAGPIEGQMCHLASLDYFRSATPDSHRLASDCLKREIATNKTASWPGAHLAILLVREYLVGASVADGPGHLARAVELAQRMGEIHPLSPRVQFAKFLTAFYDKRYEEAFAAGERARELDPDFPNQYTYVGAAYIARGQYARGAALMQRSEPIAQLAPFLAIEALMRGDDDTLFALARRPGFADLPLGLVMRMVAFNRKRNLNEARDAADTLHRKFPGASDIPAFLDRSGLTDEIKDRIFAELRSVAGAIIPATHP